MKKEITVKCPICGDTWDTTSNLGEMESCKACDEVFIIHKEDVV